MDIIELLASDNFIMYNKHIAKICGIEEAILLGALCSYQKGFKNEEFYREQERILNDTALTLYSLRKAMKTLQSLGILSITKRGLPAKHYYKINTDTLAKFLSSRPIENDSTSAFENDSTNNNYYKNNCYKENILKENSDVQETNSSSNTNLTSSTMFDLNSESQSSKPNALTSEKVCITDTSSIAETKPSHTNKVSVDSGKEKKDTILDIYNYWNNLGKPTHTNLTDAFVKAIKKALKTYSSEEIKKAMQNYKTVINDNSYYFDYRWGIDTFLNRSNGLPHFVDSGEKWLNYCKKKGINSTQFKQEEYNFDPSKPMQIKFNK